ncbi:MAG: TonB-dependent receptor [Henriciella sp.]|uniref:TonB-dependent receptor n=1 Tax=Henriciella sp. TaxID=1968823 RepID=UPI003C75A584
MPAHAQDADAEAEARQDVVVVTGIRSALEEAMDIKRNADGVVDAISAEDIGKFPDTNLAESLQRITGVSISRTNGEGSEITVRGFGPDFNLVTLNGRTMPTAETRLIGQRGNFGAGGDRAFDFSNLASEGVSTLEVYKTGQATLPTGGIGATVNIKTARPLDNSEAGFVGSGQVKGVMDDSVINGDDITPELSGIASWTDSQNRMGVSLFGSYAKRDSAAPTQQINDWLVFDPAVDGAFEDSGYVRGDGSTQITNSPKEGQLYAIPQDSRYDLSEISRERINGQLVLQFRPMDNVTLTGDYTFAQNDSEELRFEQTNWFATPFDEIIFNNNGPVASAAYMQENNDGSKDIGFEQTDRATRDTLNSLGFNADWELNENMSFILDAHSSISKSRGNNALGHSATFVTFGAPVILSHSVDYRSGYPVQTYTIDDSVRGNDNGILDAGDLGTQVQRSSTANAKNSIDEIDLRFEWEMDNSRLIVGGNYRDSTFSRAVSTTQQDLGSWGIGNPGDVEQFAPGLVTTYCLECTFDDLPVGQADVAFRSNPTQLFPIFADAYSGNSVNYGGSNDTVNEEITSLYAQFQMEGEFFARPARMNAGVRYEETEVTSDTLQTVPEVIVWGSDNDFLVRNGPDRQSVSGSASYDYLLPNLDLQIDLTDDIVARASFSKTIGRVAFANLFASTTANAPNRPTALGGQVTGSSQNPSLLPLESDNFDISLEWYFDESSYVSIGYFDKRVKNFIGNGVVDRSLFDLRDPTSGAAGSRSGDALDIIADLGVDESEANLFTLVALIDANGGNVAAARSEFQSRLGTDGADPNALPQSYVDAILTQYDVVGDANDPLLVFAVGQPINNREGNIDGLELAGQHFFGDTGFGVAGSYTMVNGDVELDPGASPAVDQFALTGLSDTYNITGIYENYGFSARLAYNWRDTFLSATNQTGDRSGVYVEDYGQWDLNVSYDINDQIAVAFEAINLTGEDQRTYHRVPEQVYYAYELSPRYILSARYRF